MASPSIIVSTPDHELLNFKQREAENLKDAWYRICNAQNRSTRKQSTSVLLCNFYVGITPWNRYIIDTITEGNFLGSHTFDSYNAMLDLFGSPPLLVNGTMLTLEHVMQRLEIIENKVATIESIENLDKKIHNQITQYGSNVGMTLKIIKENEPIVNEKINLDSTRIDKLEGIITNLGTAFSSIKNTYNDELVVQYEGPKEEPIPPKIDLGDFCPIKFSPFDYFFLPQRKLSTEHREYEMSFTDLSYYYGTT